VWRAIVMPLWSCRTPVEVGLTAARRITWRFEYKLSIPAAIALLIARKVNDSWISHRICRRHPQAAASAVKSATMSGARHRDVTPASHRRGRAVVSIEQA
jgi:hypothetical protein